MKKTIGNLINNESGISLMEVIASIVIITFILISFIKIFPLMELKNNQNEDKQSGVNLVKSELNYWKNLIETSNDFNAFLQQPLNPTSFIDSSDVVTQSTNSIKIETTTKNRSSDFKLEIIIYVNPDINTSPKKAYQIHTKLLNIKNTPISEIYGYIFY